jgi:Lrp/AsnC family transcriptional regulator, leucine-responsive regulatory protein
MKRTLDAVDLHILAALRRDARIEFSDLAVLVRVTSEECEQRIKRMESEGVIQAYSAVIDTSCAGGLFTALVEVTLKDQHPGTRERFETLMRDTPEVVFCSALSGAYDYVARLACREFEHFQILSRSWIEGTDSVVARIHTNPEVQLIKLTSGLPIG